MPSDPKNYSDFWKDSASRFSPPDFNDPDQDYSAAELMRMQYEMEDSPCMDCPNRDDSFCRFYKVELDITFDGIFIPCDKCDDDCE